MTKHASQPSITTEQHRLTRPPQVACFETLSGQTRLGIRVYINDRVLILIPRNPGSWPLGQIPPVIYADVEETFQYGQRLSRFVLTYACLAGNELTLCNRTLDPGY